MERLVHSRRLVVAVALGVVIFAFWRALIGGGSLVSEDFVALFPPFDSHQPDGFTYETGPGDPINIHAHWAPLADDVRSGDFSWWNRSHAGGQPTMKGGLPIFDLAYLLVPAWYAPGLVAALRALTAIGLSFGFLRAAGLRRVAALVGGLAFGFSGFMVGWMNWPHSSVAALAPGLLWATERVITDPRLWRAVPIGAVVAAMVWANFPLATIYVVMGAIIYAIFRVRAEYGGRGHSPLPWRRLTSTGTVALVLAAGWALPHVIGFSDYLGWADTSHRGQGPADSSAGAEYLLTAVAPGVWGSDALEVPWYGYGNWTEVNAHAGATVVILAVIGLVAGLHGDRRRRSIVAALALISGIGALVAYVGGPAAVLISELTGDIGGLMTRAKVLLSLGLALLAAFAVDDIMAGWHVRERHARSVTLGSLGIFVVLGVALAPSALHWARAARAAGVVEETAATAITPLIAGTVVVGVFYCASRRWITGMAAGWVLVAAVAYELLSFAMPVPTIVSRSERLSATPAHAEVVDTLEPGERLAGEGRTFFPATTAHYGIDDARGPVLKSLGYQALLRTIDPSSMELSGGGTPTYPNIATGTDPASPIWDVMGVGVWAQHPTSMPPGVLTKPELAFSVADPGVGAVVGETVVPPGGLRAVLIEAAIAHPGYVDVEIGIAGTTFHERRWRDPMDWHFMPVPVLGEEFEPGTEVSVRLWADQAATIAVSIDTDKSMMLGTIAGGDRFKLFHTGDVLLLERLDNSIARLFDAAIVEPDMDAAARLLDDSAGRPSEAIVSRPLDLPTIADPSARLQVTSIAVEPSRTTIEIDTDRDSLLVVSQVAYPGWTARIDGLAADVITAELAFTAVVVPEGSHEVVFEFAPSHLGWTMIVFISALVVACAVLFLAIRRGDLRFGPRTDG